MIQQFSNGAETLCFDVREILDDCGTGGTFSMHFLKPGAKSAYTIPAQNIRLENGTLEWTLTRYETDTNGYGKCQYKYENGAVKRDGAVCRIRIKRGFVILMEVEE